MKTIRARVHNGLIEPLEKLDIEEGIEVFITILNLPAEASTGGFEKSAGAWADSIDAEKLIMDIYSDRLISTREEPKI